MSKRQERVCGIQRIEITPVFDESRMALCILVDLDTTLRFLDESLEPDSLYEFQQVYYLLTYYLRSTTFLTKAHINVPTSGEPVSISISIDLRVSITRLLKRRSRGGYHPYSCAALALLEILQPINLDQNKPTTSNAPGKVFCSLVLRLDDITLPSHTSQNRSP